VVFTTIFPRPIASVFLQVPTLWDVLVSCARHPRATQAALLFFLLVPAHHVLPRRLNARGPPDSRGVVFLFVGLWVGFPLFFYPCSFAPLSRFITQCRRSSKRGCRKCTHFCHSLTFLDRSENVESSPCSLRLYPPSGILFYAYQFSSRSLVG